MRNKIQYRPSALTQHRLRSRDTRKDIPDPGNAHYESYKGFANTLRAWLIAYGIGGPVLIVSQQSVWTKLSSSSLTVWITIVFLFGVSLQVAHAALFKWVQWELYVGADNEELQQKPRYKLADSLSINYLIDAVLDFGAIILFGIGTFLLLIALTAQPASPSVHREPTQVPIFAPSPD